MLSKTKRRIKQNPFHYSQIIPEISSQSQECRDYYHDKPLEWMQYYLHEIFSQPFAEYHSKILQYIQIKGQLTVVVIFRGSGKTTLLYGYTAYCVAEGLEPYICHMKHDSVLALSESRNLAKEFQTNERILKDYGYLPSSGAIEDQPWHPGKGDLCFTTGVRVRYIGLRTMLRSTTSYYDRKRLSWLCIDDPTKDYTEAHSVPHTTRTCSIIRSDAAYAGTQKRPVGITVVGTPMSNIDVISTALREPLSRVIKLPGILGDAELIKEFIQTISNDITHIDQYQKKFSRTLTSDEKEVYCQERSQYHKYMKNLTTAWPESISIPDCVFSAANWGTMDFMREVQLQGEDPRFKKIHEYWFHEYISLPIDYILENCVCSMGVDLGWDAESVKNNDPCAIIVQLFDKVTMNRYWLWICIDWFSPYTLGYKIFEIANQPVPFYPQMKLRELPDFSVIVEANAYQKAEEDILMLISELELTLKDSPVYLTDGKAHKKGDKRPRAFHDVLYFHPFTIILIEQHKDKMERIYDERRELEGGYYYYIPGHSQQNLGKLQWVNFEGSPTHGIEDLTFKVDLPDANTMINRYQRKFAEMREQEVIAGVGERMF